MTVPDPRDHLAGKYEQMSALDKVEWMVETDGYALEVVAPDAAALLPELLATVAAADTQITAVEVKEPNLESVFLHLTGKALRE